MAGIEARLGMSLDDIIKKTKEVAKVCVCLAVRARRACWIAESGLRVAGRGSVVRARGGGARPKPTSRSRCWQSAKLEACRPLCPSPTLCLPAAVE